MQFSDDVVAALKEITDLSILAKDLESQPNAFANSLLDPGPRDIPDSLHDFCRELGSRAIAKKQREFTVNVSEETFWWRGRITKTTEGDRLFLRRILAMPPALEDPAMGLSLYHRELLLHPNLRNGGMVIVCGAMGQGKTTTVAATLVSRLRRYGGHAFTIEDPDEIRICGKHVGPNGGLGHCVQVAIPEGGSYGEFIKGAMRQFPVGQGSMMMLGEVRDADSAAEALRMGAAGVLVILTIHGSSIADSLQRLMSLASIKTPESDALSLMASGIRVVLHQRLSNSLLHVESLAVSEGQEGATARSYISKGDFSKLGQVIETQRNRVNNRFAHS